MKILNLFIFILTFNFSITTQADDAQTPNKTFEALYAELKNAMDSRNTKHLAQMLAPGFQSEDTSGKTQSAEQMIDDVSKLPADRNKKSLTSIISVNLSETYAQVRQKYHMNTIKISPEGKRSYIELDAISDDTWCLINGSWKISRTVTRQLDYLSDGKAAIHSAHP